MPDRSSQISRSNCLIGIEGLRIGMALLCPFAPGVCVAGVEVEGRDSPGIDLSPKSADLSDDSKQVPYVALYQVEMEHPPSPF